MTVTHLCRDLYVVKNCLSVWMPTCVPEGSYHCQLVQWPLGRLTLGWWRTRQSNVATPEIIAIESSDKRYYDINLRVRCIICLTFVTLYSGFRKLFIFVFRCFYLSTICNWISNNRKLVCLPNPLHGWHIQYCGHSLTVFVVGNSCCAIVEPSSQHTNKEC